MKQALDLMHENVPATLIHSMPHDTTITPRFHENYARRQIEDHHVM
jgi:hypothetical protein